MTTPSEEAPPIRLFDAESIAIATFLGSPLAGSLLWAINERRVGRTGNAIVALVVGSVITGALLFVSSLGVPTGATLPISLGLTFGARAAAATWRERLLTPGHVAESRGLAVLAGLVGIVLVFAMVFALGLGGVREGDACEGAVAECEGSDAALWCDGGAFRRIDCRGTGGCTDVDQRIACAQAEGDACLEGRGACLGNDFLRCVGGAMARITTCRGPGGCSTAEGSIHCDESLGEIGDGCTAPDGAGACTADATGFLTCQSGRFVLAARCRGARACHHEGTRVECDETVGVLGEACTGSGGTCSADTLAWLQCEDGTWAPHRACRGAAHCAIAGGQLHCDESVSAEGDPCGGEGVACTEDGHAQLRCSGGQFSLVTQCLGPAGCTITDGQLACDGPAPLAPERPGR